MRLNTLTTLTLTTIIALFASCSSDDDGIGNGGKTFKSLVGTVNDKELVDDDAPSMRSSLSLGTSGMVFKWHKADPSDPDDHSDRLTIFSDESDIAVMTYTLENIRDGETAHKASFTGSGFDLTDGKRYYALYPCEKDAPEGSNYPSKRNITVNYAGQRQTANSSTEHLGQYDYLAASGLAAGTDHADFTFDHLGLTLRVIMEGLPTDKSFERMEMYDSENSYLQPLRSINLANCVTADGSFVPAFEELDVNSAAYKTADRFSLDLGPANGTGIQTDGRLEMFIEVPPANLTGKDVIFMAYTTDQEAYYIKCTGRDLVGGKAYQMKGTAQKADSYTIKIKVNHDWQLGTTVSTRATGDPGIEDEFPYPANLYYILCVNGTVKAVNSKSVTEIEGIPENKWARSADGAISTYAESITFNFDETEIEQSKNLYIVASNDDLSDVFSSISASTTEESVRNTLYSVGGTDKQEFLKNLYSTPYKEGTVFIGALDKDYFKDIILYHVAAKVDIKWNTTTALTDYISVNNVKASGLLLFRPTENPYATGNYTVAVPFTEGTNYNGRQYFYLPQFTNDCTYDVTIGSTNSLVTFTPATTNGFTSWMRWLNKF